MPLDIAYAVNLLRYAAESSAAILQYMRFMRPIRAFAVVVALIVALAPSHARAQSTGVVFLDRNANGVRDRGEPGIGGVVVSNQVDVVATDVTGHYTLGAGGRGMTFVSLPRGHRVAGSWWKVTPAGGTVDFGLTPNREPVPYTFAQASDTHISPTSAPRTRRMVSIVDSIKPSLLIITGDLVRDALRVGEAEATGYYQLFNDEMRALRTPVVTVPGNHENFGIERAKSQVSTSHPLYGRAMYHKFRGPDYYSFNAAGVHFVALNSVDIDDQSYYGHVDSVQVAWLRRDLALVPDSVPVVTFNHIPMASMAEGLNGPMEGVAPSLITINGKPQYRHTVSNVGEVLAALGAHRWEIALGGHVHYRETLALDLGGKHIRFHQTGAIVGDGGAGPFTLPSSITVYTIRNGVVDDGRVVLLGKVPPG